MSKRLFFTFIWTWLSLLVFNPFSLTAKEEGHPSVLVSVAPHKFFVEKIAGNTVDVILMVPAAASAHTYEPTPRQMLAASKAQLWFRIGETFENRAIQALRSHRPDLIIVDMRQGLDLIAEGCCHHHASLDLHFWLSARLAKKQAETIAQALSQAYPQHQELYAKNLKKFHEELDQLDQDIQTILLSISNRNILVSHPAYAYFCRDYDLRQFSIEFEGKDPTPQQLTKVLKLAKDLKIRTIFIQMQYNNKGARLIAEQIGAKVVTLDPYSEQFYESMLEIARAFAEA
jgi:zinc transport system substrate-binding protein